MDAVMYTIFAILAVYGAYTAVREIVLFFVGISEKDKDDCGHSLCDRCIGCCQSDDDENDENEAVDDDTDAEDTTESP